MLTWLDHVVQLARKELAGLRSDKVLLAFIVWSFTLDVVNIAKGVRTDVRNASVAVVDDDRSMLSARIRDALLPPYFRPPREIGREQVDTLMDRGEASFVLDIPPHFERDALAGRAPPLQLLIDATAMTQAGIGSGYIQAILGAEAARLAPVAAGSTSAIRTSVRAYFNPNLQASWFQSVLAVIEKVTTLSILLVGAAVMRERERGTIEHLLTLPLRASEIAAAKILANGLVILLGATLSLTLVVERWLAIPIQGSLALFALGTGVYLFATLSLGILISTVTRSMPQFALMAIPVFLVLTQLSGGTSPLDALPTWLQALLQLSPSVHYVALAQAVLYRGAELTLVWPQLVALTALGGVFLALALGRFRTMLGKEV
jgi:ABC-2 type transport system permease protein